MGTTRAIEFDNVKKKKFIFFVSQNPKLQKKSFAISPKQKAESGIWNLERVFDLKTIEKKSHLAKFWCIFLDFDFFDCVVCVIEIAIKFRNQNPKPKPKNLKPKTPKPLQSEILN